MKINYLLMIMVVFFWSCSSDNDAGKVITTEAADSAVVEQPVEQLMETEEAVAADTSGQMESGGEEEAAPKEELKQLPQVTFCDCIKKQKALDDRLMETEDDAEINKIMADMDELSAGPCKNLLADKSTSPDAREERKAKIAKCLGN